MLAPPTTCTAAANWTINNWRPWRIYVSLAKPRGRSKPNYKLLTPPILPINLPTPWSISEPIKDHRRKHATEIQGIASLARIENPCIAIWLVPQIAKWWIHLLLQRKIKLGIIYSPLKLMMEGQNQNWKIIHFLGANKITLPFEKIINRNFLLAQKLTVCNRLNITKTLKKEGYG